MTESQFREIWKKTDGHCHFCGDPVVLRKRGYRRVRADGSWEVDHVVQRRKGGQGSVSNYLPACTACNRLRWHRTGPALRQLLILGMVANREVEMFTETGKALIRLMHYRSIENATRRGSKHERKRNFDPVAKALIRKVERDLLIDFLRKRFKQRFTPMELSKRTGVPKIRVRVLLEASRKVTVSRRAGQYVLQASKGVTHEAQSHAREPRPHLN